MAYRSLLLFFNRRGVRRNADQRRGPEHILAAELARDTSGSPDHVDRDRQAFLDDMRAKGMRHFEFNRSRAEMIGATHYIWRTALGRGCCPTCAAYEGKFFAFDVPPPSGHPGHVGGCLPGYCRCYAEPVLPDIIMSGVPRQHGDQADRNA